MLPAIHMTETALITGINGFIGTHLKETLEKRDIRVIGIPRDLLNDNASLTLFIRKENPAYIFHLAAYGNHIHQQNDIEALMVNYWGTYMLLSASQNIPYKAFINVATSSMYGHTDTPMSENNPLQPDTFYAASKAGAMYLARAFAKQYNKPITTAIPFSVFGEGEADHRFIPRVCKSLITGGKMSVAPAPTHDWIYVKDFVDALMVLVTSIDRVRGEWVNISMGERFTNQQVINKLISLSGRTLQYEEDYKEPANHSPLWVADNTKLKSLGWEPKYGVQEGFKRTWEYYSKKYSK